MYLEIETTRGVPLHVLDQINDLVADARLPFGKYTSHQVATRLCSYGSVERGGEHSRPIEGVQVYEWTVQLLPYHNRLLKSAISGLKTGGYWSLTTEDGQIHVQRKGEIFRAMFGRRKNRGSASLAAGLSPTSPQTSLKTQEPF